MEADRLARTIGAVDNEVGECARLGEDSRPGRALETARDMSH